MLWWQNRGRVCRFRTLPTAGVGVFREQQGMCVPHIFFQDAVSFAVIFCECNFCFRLIRPASKISAALFQLFFHDSCIMRLSISSPRPAGEYTVQEKLIANFSKRENDPSLVKKCQRMLLPHTVRPRIMNERQKTIRNKNAPTPKVGLFSSFVAVLLTRENVPCFKKSQFSEKGIKNAQLATLNGEPGELRLPPCPAPRRLPSP